MLNVQCLRNKIAEVELLCSSNNVDFLCLCEHWMTNDEIQYHEQLLNLRLLNYFCRESPWGGVAIFMRQELSYVTRPIDLSAYCEELHAEFAGSLIPELSLIVIAMYRSPSGKVDRFLHLLELCLTFLVSFDFSIVIGTDHNINLSNDSCDKTAFLNLLRSFGLYCATDLPTRGESSLDTFLTNIDTWDYSTSVSSDQIADHKHVFMHVNKLQILPCKPKYKVVTFRNFNETSIRNFTNDLKMHVTDIWQNCTEFLPPYEAFLFFFNSFISTFDYNFPELSKTVTVGMNRPTKRHSSCSPESWFNPELARLKNMVLIASDLSRVSPNMLPLLRRLRSHYRKMIREAKAQATVNSFSKAKNPCKAAWNFINSKLPHSTSRPIKTDFATADEFNAHFVNSVHEILCNIPGPSNPAVVNSMLLRNVPHTNDKLVWNHVNSIDVINIVNNFKNSESKDVYGVSVNLIKHVIDIIAPLLSHLINGCLDFGVFPDVLKVSRTVPVFKKGSCTELASYRPISILPVFSKIFETVLFHQIYDHLESHSLLVPAQYGFRRHRSTVLAVESLLKTVLEAFERNQSCSFLLCDLSRAFDTVQHDVLLRKLELYLGGDALRILSSYLEGRWQSVSWNGVTSAPLAICHGVPQGSVLGPLLFIIAINDLYYEVSGNVCIFADDSTLYSCGNDPLHARVTVNSLMSLASHWFEVNKFALNQSKTQEITFSLSKVAYESDPVKLLGFTLDSKLRWEAHTDLICKRLSRSLYLLRRLSADLPGPYLRQAYYAFFHSIMSYGIRLWGHSSNVHKILLLQKRAVRIVSGAGWLDHCRPLFIKNNILTVTSLYVLECILEIKRNLMTYNKNSSIHNHGTRSIDNIFIPRFRLNKSTSCFPVTGMTFFNKLPLAVRSLSDSKFKTIVKNWLVANPLYNVKEFFDLDYSRLREYL